MKTFKIFFIFLLKIFEVRAFLNKPGTNSLRKFLHSSSNITYFEPVNYDKDSILKQHKAAIQSPQDNVVIIELNAFKRHFSLILRQDTNLFSQGPRVKIKAHKKEDNFELNSNEYYTGKVSGDENSSVTGRIRADGTLDGYFYTEGTLHHLEPASRYFIHPLPFHSLVYQSHDVEFDSSLRIAAKKVTHSYRKLHQLAKNTSFQTPNRRSRAARLSHNNANTCTLHIAADHRFYNHVGKGSVDETIAEMVFHVAGADKIFRSTDFNGDRGPGDNIGVTIAAITLFQDAEAEGILAEPSSTFLDFLSKWSTFNHDEYCLALLFTFLDFPKGTLGLAWVGAIDIGGICSKRVLLEDSELGELNFNSGVVTFRNHGKRIPRKASLITVAHELGHSFGAEHDPTTKKCSPNENGGNYIMYEFSTGGREPNNYLFSKCSKSQMWPIISQKGPSCFIADNQGVYCGNRIVEEGEECDCGLPHECHLIDKCCEPRNESLGTPGCTLKNGYQCSPKKGPCCTQDCMPVTTPDTICKEETQCTYEVVCNYNATCPPAVSKPPNTTCNDGSNTCVDGECIGSICTLYGMEECQCPGYHLMCHVCCNNTKDGCVTASIIAGRQVVLKPAGSTCNQDTGYCGQHGSCITVKTDSQLRVLKEAFERTTSKASVNNALLWLGNNWHYIVALIAGAFVVAFWLKFTSSRNNPLERILRRVAILPHHHNRRDRNRATVNPHLPAEQFESGQTASTAV